MAGAARTGPAPHALRRGDPHVGATQSRSEATGLLPLLEGEKSICSSFSLAAWDRSVALGWRRLTANGTASGDLEEQKAWLRTRDACGADAACLEEQLKRRALNLADR
jgi:hypothetical protein